MAQHAHPEHSGSTLTLLRVEPYEHRGIAITSPAVDADGWISDDWSGYGDNTPPPLAWSAVIEAQSYALVVEDPDAPQVEPFIHWLIWNIPGAATGLPQGVEQTAHPSDPKGAIQGRNGMGRFGWFGPRPPEGHGVHHYHFQLFALSAPLDGMGPNTTLPELVNALKGLTIASGELVGLYERRGPGDLEAPGATGSYGEDAGSADRYERENGRGGLDADDPDLHAPHTPDGEVKRS